MARTFQWTEEAKELYSAEDSCWGDFRLLLIHSKTKLVFGLSIWSLRNSD